MSERPYFETVRSFANVPITEYGVDTVSFLEASYGLVKLFDLLGSGVFGFVQADIKGNIEERCFLFTIFSSRKKLYILILLLTGCSNALPRCFPEFDDTREPRQKRNIRRSS
ncbi:hypothetical protein JVU11DRAFT_12634 [Chiua virens]|nr:hypothetical protein JVU11DRAFT_12634 [Chiua virens]